MWQPCTKNPPAPGYRWRVGFLRDEDWRGGVIYWVERED